jgi:hypothetical protein
MPKSTSSGLMGLHQAKSVVLDVVIGLDLSQDLT